MSEFRDVLAALDERGVLSRATSLKVGDVEVQMFPIPLAPDKTVDRTTDPARDPEILFGSS